MKVGDIVHYKSYGSKGGEYTPECRAAIVTQIGKDTEGRIVPEVIGLCAVNPTGMFFHEAVIEDATQERGGTWHAREDCDQ